MTLLSKVLSENMSQNYFGCNLIPQKQERELLILKQRYIRQDLGKEETTMDPGPLASGVCELRVSHLSAPIAVFHVHSMAVIGRRER